MRRTSLPRKLFVAGLLAVAAGSAPAQDAAPSSAELRRAMLEPVVVLEARLSRIEELAAALADRVRNAPSGTDPALGSDGATPEETVQLLRSRSIELISQIQQKNARIAELEKRLAVSGLSAAPGFAYLGDVVESFVSADKLAILAAPEARLTAEQCAEALDWLSTRQDEEFWLLQQVWVWEGDTPHLCRPAEDGSPVVRPASASSEAHLVIYR